MDSNNIKSFVFRLAVISALAGVILGCRKDNPVDPVDPVDPADTTSRDTTSADTSSHKEHVVPELATMWRDKYGDDNIFTSVDDLDDVRIFFNGEYVFENKTLNDSRNDCRIEFYNDSTNLMRYVSVSDGYAVNVPSGNGLEVDYTLAKYGMAFKYDNAKFRITMETVTPYTQNANGYNIYTTEWLDRYISNKKYMTQNNMSYYINPVKNSTEYIDGYDVTIYSIKINNPGNIKYPFYKIAIIRKSDQYAKFGLLLYKSTARADDLFEEIVKSFRYITAFGKSKNYMAVQQPIPDPDWNAETRAYYQKLIDQQGLDFGVFAGSFESTKESSYYEKEAMLQTEFAWLQGPEGMDHTMEIAPTYNHIAWGSSKIYFPSEMAEEFAGGNGFNGKPVLQMSYQYTTNNNYVSVANKTAVGTPMWDILRGKYDDHFAQYADAIKAYGKPVLFRLNNEMNSDWTSYCGMMTLLDPDIFIETWQYLYNIFKSRGVDNCIWIFNPIATTCPYCRWGEDLTYYPGNDYCQMLGLTNYEAANSLPLTSFRDRYTTLYEKNKDLFSNLPWIISEFGCGSGGDYSGEYHRNASQQAAWVAAMFQEFASRSADYIKPIKGAVWFDANDYSGDQVTNCYKLDSTLTETMQAFRDGFASLQQ